MPKLTGQLKEYAWAWEAQLLQATEDKLSIPVLNRLLIAVEDF